MSCGVDADAADLNPIISAKGKHPNNSFSRRIVRIICFLGKWTLKRSNKDKLQPKGSIEMDKIWQKIRMRNGITYGIIK